jgi:hypothetical protein
MTTVLLGHANQRRIEVDLDILLRLPGEGGWGE